MAWGNIGVIRVYYRYSARRAIAGAVAGRWGYFSLLTVIHLVPFRVIFLAIILSTIFNS